MSSSSSSGGMQWLAAIVGFLAGGLLGLLAGAAIDPAGQEVGISPHYQFTAGMAIGYFAGAILGLLAGIALGSLLRVENPNPEWDQEQAELDARYKRRLRQ